MATLAQIDRCKNQLLAALPEAEYARLAPYLQIVTPRQNEALYHPEEPIDYVYFPENCVLSSLVTLADGRSVAVNLIGDEGVLGVPAILGSKRSEQLAVVQIAGKCIKARAAAVQTEFKRGGVLQDRLLRYIRYLLTQTAQTAACNRMHLLEQRLATWLLMTHDRAKKDEIPITHEFLCHILGTPRSEVTLAAGLLRKSPLICYGRGRLTILDRPGLEAIACECYRALTEELNTALQKTP